MMKMKIKIRARERKGVKGKRNGDGDGERWTFNKQRLLSSLFVEQIVRVRDPCFDPIHGIERTPMW